MAQPRFAGGRLTTAYIAEEFPDGFHGADLDDDRLRRLAALAFVMNARTESRAAGGGADRPLAARIGPRAVLIGERRWDFAFGDEDFLVRQLPDGTPFPLRAGWRPGETTAFADFDDMEMIARVDRVTGGFRIRHHGADLPVRVLFPHVADLLPLMPKKVAPDLSRYLMCPMPGQVVRIDVAEGDIVEDGQPLAIVEAMKMENVLRAERRARVARVRVAAGAVLAVDEVILEFEAV
jgi:propionyl-CoA carboxylase alpha chain